MYLVTYNVKGKMYLISNGNCIARKGAIPFPEFKNVASKLSCCGFDLRATCALKIIA